MGIDTLLLIASLLAALSVCMYVYNMYIICYVEGI